MPTTIHHTTPNDDKVKCYGKIIDCPNRTQCELGKVCLSAAKESADNLHWQLSHVSVPNLLYDPNDADDTSTNDDETHDDTSVAYFNASTVPENSTTSDLVLEGITIPHENIPLVLQVLEKIAEWYFYTPKSFEALMNKIFRKKSQSDIAKEKHISRQAVNKTLRSELRLDQKRNTVQERKERELSEATQEYIQKLEEMRQIDAFFKTLSSRDWQIYKLAFIDGCTRESISSQLHIGTATVGRVIQFLRSNLNKNDTIKRGRKKKNRKK